MLPLNVILKVPLFSMELCVSVKNVFSSKIVFRQKYVSSKFFRHAQPLRVFVLILFIFSKLKAWHIVPLEDSELKKNNQKVRKLSCKHPIKWFCMDKINRFVHFSQDLKVSSLFMAHFTRQQKFRTPNT